MQQIKKLSGNLPKIIIKHVENMAHFALFFAIRSPDQYMWVP